MEPLKKVIAVSLVQSCLKFAAIDNSCVYAHKLGLLLPIHGHFLILASSIYTEWARKNSSTMGFGINFSPADCYETFPFPASLPETLSPLGDSYDALRKSIMAADQIGLTQLYNAFHNPDNQDERLEEMRRLQREIDLAVRDAYGWQDIDLAHGFHAVSYLPANDNIRYTISEPARIEILKRLSTLNKQRWEEEQRT